MSAYIRITIKNEIMTENRILTTGIYDAIKEHVRRKQVNAKAEELLLGGLRSAKQVLRRELPDDVVTVNNKIKVKDHSTGKVNEYILIGTNTKPKAAKLKYSILSEIGLSTLGYKVGDVIEWPFDEGIKKIEILEKESVEI